jgi:cytochrome c-type biogenesis protein CcmH/NrfG
MSVKEREQYLNLRSKAQFSPYFMHYLLGNVLFDEGNYDEALAVLAKAEQASPKSVRLLTLIGRVYLEMKRPDDAEQSFSKVIGFDPLHPDAHLGLTRVAAGPRPVPAARRQAGLKTVGLRYHFPWAHHYLGVALEGLKRYKQAAQAFEVAVSQNPNLLEAHRRLEHLYSHVLGGSPAARAKAEEHTRAIAEIGARIEAPRPARRRDMPQGGRRRRREGHRARRPERAEARGPGAGSGPLRHRRRLRPAALRHQHDDADARGRRRPAHRRRARRRRRQPQGLLRVRARQAPDDRPHLAARGRRQGGEDHRPAAAVPAARSRTSSGSSSWSATWTRWPPRSRSCSPTWTRPAPGCREDKLKQAYFLDPGVFFSVGFHQNPPQRHPVVAGQALRVRMT